MRGHIKQRSKGSWSIVIDTGRDPQTGKRHQQWHTIRGTKKDAESKLRELLQAIEIGSYTKPTKLTVGEWLEQWYQNYVVMHTSVRTAESYGAELRRHIIPALGALPLTQLQPQHLQNYYAKSLIKGRKRGEGGLSRQTILYHHRLLSQALGYAVRQGLLARNLAEAVDPPRPKRVAMATIAPEDVPQFLGGAKETSFYELFYTALYTGMRRGELLALRWRDVDLDLASLSVVQSLHRSDKGEYIIKEPKSPQSRRSIALPPSLAILLREYKAKQEDQRLLLGKPLSDADFVFSRIDGQPIAPDTITHTFGKIIKRTKLPHVRFHDLRHTHATLMLKAGIHPKIVSERLGHSKVGITLDIYSHVVPGLQEAAAERFDKMLEPKSNQTEGVSKMLAKMG